MNDLPLGRGGLWLWLRCSAVLVLVGGEERRRKRRRRCGKWPKGSKKKAKAERESTVDSAVGTSRGKRRGRSLKGERVERWRTRPARVQGKKESMEGKQHRKRDGGAWIGEPEVCRYCVQATYEGQGLAWLWSSLLAGVEASKAKERYL